MKLFEKIHIVNYNRSQIKVSPLVEGEMNRLRTNVLTLPPRPEFMPNKRALKIAHVNIRGLKSKLDDIKNYEDLQKVDIVCFSETKP